MHLLSTITVFTGLATAFTPANYYGSNNSSQNASTPIKPVLSSSIRLGKQSENTISLKATDAPKVCGPSTVTVYETAYGGKVQPTGTVRNGYYANASPSAKVAKPFGYKEEQFKSSTGEDVKLQACNHWSHDAKNPKNLIPNSVGEKTQLYYAENGKPRKYLNVKSQFLY